MLSSVDTTDFQRAFKEYMKVTSRTLTESVNQHAYYMAKAAVNLTYAEEAHRIEDSLKQGSKIDGAVPVACILVNYFRGKGKRQIIGQEMTNAAVKFIKTRVAHRNFLRAGWIPAVKNLANYVPKKSGGKPIPAGTDKVSRRKAKYGGGYPSLGIKWSPVASFWNNIAALYNNPKIQAYIEQGAQAAIAFETQSMIDYMENQISEHSRRLMS